MKRKNRVVCKILVLLMALAIVWEASTVAAMAGETETTQAAEQTSITILEVVEATTDIEAKEEPDDGSKTLTTFEQGASIAVVEEVDSVWYAIGYQGNIYYVKKAQTVPIEQGYDTEALNREFEEEFIESKIFVEEVERQQNEAKNTRIWGIVIIVLVVAILGVGVYSHLSGKKNEKSK